jgi:hypothetical protein
LAAIAEIVRVAIRDFRYAPYVALEAGIEFSR